MNDLFKDILERTPTEPGVYLMKGKRNGKIFYVGKAVDLRARLRQYFTGADPRPFAQRLPRLLGDVETVLTRNEKEALLLENRLIKAHQPRFNVKLRDDKNFLSLRIDRKAEWPRVQVVRRQKRDGAQYFGPYHSAASVRQALRVLNKHFGLRTCPDHVLRNRSRPCLQYQIKRCPGPCVFDVDREAYELSVRESVMFLQGKQGELIASLKTRMAEASERWEYELAAHYRDQIRDVEKSLERQQVESVKAVDQDIIGLYREGEAVSIELLYLRKGIITGTRRYFFTSQEPTDELLVSFVLQYYIDNAGIPHEVLLPERIPSQSTLAEILSEQRGTRVRISKPARGDRKALLEIAVVNAKQAFEEAAGKSEQRQAALEKLRSRLHLTALPTRIECFDISNFQETAIVGAMVVFTDGEPDKSQYRSFRVRTTGKQDDFAAMEEVLTRRIKRSQVGDEPWPDLMVIDGGKGQLGAVVRVLQDLGAHHVPVVSLAKSRLKETRDSGGEKVRTDERIFIPNAKDPIRLRTNTAELHLMQRIRDEAHRSAITYHKKLRKKQSLGSVLDRIKGVGPAKRRTLLKHFGSLSRVKAAGVDELADAPGVSEALARRIWDALQG